MRWDYLIILVVLGLFIPWRTRAHVRALLDSPTQAAVRRINLHLSTIAFQCAIVAIIVWRFHAHSGNWSALGFALPHVARAMVAIVSLSGVLVLNQILGVKRLSRLSIQHRGIPGRLAEILLPQTRGERWIGLVLVSTVAVCEEIIYRGFVEYVFQLTPSAVLLGAVSSSVFFAAAHLYQGRKGLIATFIVGLLLSMARVWSATLLAPVVIHFAVDFSAAVALLRKSNRVELVPRVIW